MAAPGDLDSSFGTAGTVITPIGAGDDRAHAVAIDGSGRIIVAGAAANGSDDDFTLARYDTTGTLDPGFGTGGIVTTPIGPADDVAHAVTVDGGGGILVAGTSANGLGQMLFTLARYDATGVLDPLFGTGGVVTTAFGPGDAEARAIAIDGSGRIVLAGTATAGGDADYALARYDASGIPDAGFGSGGTVTTGFGASSDDHAHALAIDGSGRLVVAGSSGTGMPVDPDFSLARYDDTGALDGAFGSGGTVTVAVGADGDVLHAVAIDGSDRIVAAGWSHDAVTLDDVVVARLDATGVLDPAFGAGGVATSAQPGDDTGATLVLEPSGRIVVAGAAGGDAVLAAFTAAGALDAGFGSAGVVTTAIGSFDDAARAAVLDASGRIVVAGTAGNGTDLDVGVARYVDGCGDGELDAGEQCDDGNVASGDCCSSSCAFESSGSSCADDGVACTVDACDGAGTCAHTPDDALCDDGSLCSSDVCDGAGCVHAPANAGSTCRASTGACDPAEACDGVDTACPSDLLEPNGTTCRAAADECDVAEACDGVSASCPADDVASLGTACTDDGETCTIDVCDGTGTACTHPAGNAGATCRATNGICDVGETCDGTATTCPPDAFQPASFTCRASGGECDVAESCTGSGVACPADAFVPASTSCTDDGELCTIDVCSGSSAACTHPAGNAGTLCRAAADICDVSESCDGTGTTCPADAFRPGSFTCRNAVGECDLAESCTGSGAACPANGFATAGTACTDDGSTCTTDTCNGSGTCIHPAGNAGAICRAATDVCDVAETCNGSSTTCPANGFRASSFTCRAATGECDVAEHCTGIGPACPADLFTAPSTACTEDGNPCTSDRCDGSGACTHPPGNAGVACRASGSACDVAEACDGASVTCPADTGEPDSDGDSVCDAQDACTNTGGGQDFKPRPKPKIALKRINDNVIPGDDVLSIQGTFDLGVGQSFDEIDPALTGVRILLLNASGGVELDAPLPGGTYHGAGTRGWTTNGSRTKWQYADKTSDGTLTGTYGGIYQVKLQDRSRRTPREVQVKVSGRFATYPVLAGDSPVRAVVVFGGQSAAIAGLCGESSFLASDCRFNGLGTALDCRK